MPASLRLVLALLLLGALAAAVSIPVIHHQDEEQARIAAEQISGGDASAGEAAFRRYGCGGCHAVGKAAGPRGAVGPSLDGIAARSEIAGHLANQPDNMILWLRHPQQVAPGNGMPDQGIDETNARDITAYMYTLRK